MSNAMRVREEIGVGLGLVIGWMGAGGDEKQKTVYRELPRHTVLERGENYIYHDFFRRSGLGGVSGNHGPGHLTATSVIRMSI